MNTQYEKHRYKAIVWGTILLVIGCIYGLMATLSIVSAFSEEQAEAGLITVLGLFNICAIFIIPGSVLIHCGKKGNERVDRHNAEIDRRIEAERQWQQTLIRMEYERNERVKKQILDEGISFDDFKYLREKTNGDFVGVYILYNVDKEMYYVGQATRTFFRVNQHFTGKGNGDVYADYKYGDEFKILVIKLTESGYDDLDELEKDMIEKYHAYTNGYNKTKGNG